MKLSAISVWGKPHRGNKLDHVWYKSQTHEGQGIHPLHTRHTGAPKPSNFPGLLPLCIYSKLSWKNAFTKDAQHYFEDTWGNQQELQLVGLLGLCPHPSRKGTTRS